MISRVVPLPSYFPCHWVVPDDFFKEDNKDHTHAWDLEHVISKPIELVIWNSYIKKILYESFTVS